MGRHAGWLMVFAVVAGLTVGGCKKERTGPDLSNPRSAAVTFTKALEEGDLQTAKLACNASGIESDLIEAMAQSSSGIKRLNSAATARFGQEAQKIIQGQGPMNVSKNLAEGDVEQDAERATVRSKDRKDEVQLLKIDGQWRVDVGALIKGKDVTRVVPFFRAAGLAARQVADDVDAGRISSAEDARKAMATRVMANLPQMVREQMGITATRPAS